MSDFGHFALILGWALILYGVVVPAYAGISGNMRWQASGRNATVLSALCLIASFIALGSAFLQDDYTNQFVWQFSNRSMPAIYKVSAIWGGMDGSMLLWSVLLAIISAIVAWKSTGQSRLLMPWVMAALNSSSLFFTSVVVFFTNPFRYIKAPFIPPDGNGLNPLLQNPYMAIHPPMLYLGFTLMAVPYAFCTGALLSGCLSNEWLRLTRRWALIGWSFLTVGITLGGHWAYLELGWGGFWAWDPVENASFLPWLTATAFLHSVMVQERKNMLKVWNVWLVVLTYLLTVFGTFLTRSGIVQSIHAFASTDISWVFLLYLVFIALSTLALTWYRRKELRSERGIESVLSRESAFLANNLVLLSICFAILWGVMFPVFSEAVTGKKQTIGIPFFNAVNVPLFLLLLFLMGVGPLIAWRRASMTSLVRAFLWPFVSSFAVAILLVWAGVVHFYPVLAYSICFFVLMTILGELHRGMHAQRGLTNRTSVTDSFTTLLRRHRVRYGGYLVHTGVLVTAVAITASMAHKTEREFTLARGETLTEGRFTLTLNDFKTYRMENYEALAAEVTLSRAADGQTLEVLKPELRFYLRNKENTSEIALRMGPREDVYLVLAGLDETQTRAALKLFINPLQIWLWVGVAIMVLGTGVVLIPQRSRVQARMTHPSLATERT